MNKLIQAKLIDARYYLNELLTLSTTVLTEELDGSYLEEMLNKVNTSLQDVNDRPIREVFKG